MAFPDCPSRQMFYLPQKFLPWFMPKMASFVHSSNLYVRQNLVSQHIVLSVLTILNQIGWVIFPFDTNIRKALNPDTHLHTDILVMGLCAGLTPFTNKFDCKMSFEKLINFFLLLNYGKTYS